MNKKDKELEFIKGMEQLRAAPVKAEDYTSPLEQDIMRVKGGTEQIDTQSPIGRVSNATDKIDTKGIQKIQSGSDWSKKIEGLRNARKSALNSLKSVPVLGTAIGLGSALMGAEDASAAVPILDSAEPTGPARDSLEYKLETGTITPEELEILRSQYGQ